MNKNNKIYYLILFVAVLTVSAVVWHYRPVQPVSVQASTVCDYDPPSCRPDICYGPPDSGCAYYCGDSVRQSGHGEECDPPNGTTCNSSCKTISTPPLATNKCSDRNPNAGECNNGKDDDSNGKIDATGCTSDDGITTYLADPNCADANDSHEGPAYAAVVGAFVTTNGDYGNFSVTSPLGRMVTKAKGDFYGGPINYSYPSQGALWGDGNYSISVTPADGFSAVVDFNGKGNGSSPGPYCYGQWPNGSVECDLSWTINYSPNFTVKLLCEGSKEAVFKHGTLANPCVSDVGAIGHVKWSATASGGATVTGCTATAWPNSVNGGILPSLTGTTSTNPLNVSQEKYTISCTGKAASFTSIKSDTVYIRHPNRAPTVTNVSVTVPNNYCGQQDYLGTKVTWDFSDPDPGDSQGGFDLTLDQFDTTNGTWAAVKTESVTSSDQEYVFGNPTGKFVPSQHGHIYSVRVRGRDDGTPTLFSKTTTTKSCTGTGCGTWGSRVGWQLPKHTYPDNPTFTWSTSTDTLYKFDGSKTSCYNSTIVSGKNQSTICSIWDWVYGDGGGDTLASSSKGLASHNYTAAALTSNPTVTLTVTDADGYSCAGSESLLSGGGGGEIPPGPSSTPSSTGSTSTPHIKEIRP